MKAQQRYRARSVRGASAVLVIAVLVLLGGLSVHVVGLVSSVNNGYAMEANLMRATQAAESGLEWARFRVLQSNQPCAPLQNVVMPGSLGPYTVTVRCIVGGTDFTGPPATWTQYRLTVTACNLPSAGACPNTGLNPGNDYVERRASALIER